MVAKGTFRTLDELISKLESLKKIHGGDCLVGLDDPDTGWHMDFTEISYWETDEAGDDYPTDEKRVLLSSDYHQDDTKPRPIMPKYS